MWLRHALKPLILLLILSACSPRDRQAVDKLNSLSYAYHYRNLDSTEVYAQRAYDLSGNYSSGKAEAINNKAFVCIVQMRYQDAKRLLDQLPEITDNQLELLVGYIQQMRLCQRMSHNREFYDYREQAQRALGRIEEERASLSEHEQQRLRYAESELAIVTSTYYYYIGLERKSAEALKVIGPDIERDTAQFLNYLYNMGAGGMITEGTKEEINQVEIDYLMRCCLLSEKADYPFFTANSMEALAEHLMDSINTQGMNNGLIPDKLAHDALSIFSDYGDVYQIAGAYRTLASCYLAQELYDEAIECLHLALADTIINQAPDLVASIREQMSVAYAAVDNKAQSDYNRNLYLDLQEKTRQDRSLEARAGQLEQSVSQLNILLWAVGASIILLAFMVGLFYFLHRKRSSRHDEEGWLEREEELKEQLALARIHVENGERRHLEQRAKVSLVNSITPLIDRILHEVGRLDGDHREERVDYIRELTDKINEQNQLLTQWIQLRQGELTLHIETFPLQELFDFVAKSTRSFRQKGVTLVLDPTTAKVKADKVLTLFMLNTLADNARKFTPVGGEVRISAEETEQYVEIAVQDTGIGMDETQLSHVFEHHAISDDQSKTSHGFGLLNCKGIIEKYRKVSSIFSVCQIKAESQKGHGSRISFRLPKGNAVGRKKGLSLTVLLIGLMAAGPTHAQAQSVDYIGKASIYSDSAYFSNIKGTYEHTLLFADSCRHNLNNYYRSLRPQSSDTLKVMDYQSASLTELRWLHDSVPVNYDIILDIRNESAVAALALHDWPLYNYNNRIYTLLFKELSADQTLPDYCRKMQQSETNKSIAILLLVLLFIIILLAVVWQVILMINKSARRHQEQQSKLEMMNDERLRLHMEEDNLHVTNAVIDNCLSTLKHETMYYPSRIRQLVDAGDASSLAEVTTYYRALYGILSEQTMRQVEHAKLHLQPLEHEILGDRVLISYLWEILRKQSGQKTLSVSYLPKDANYIVCEVEMPQLHLTDEQAQELFTSSTADNIPYLLCRQIVRDHGEATNRRGCAIRAEVRGGKTIVIVTLPRILSNRKS